MKWSIPEVIQTSQMDCGPASLKALLDGLGVRVSYARLRDACQTDVDGTSIDALEDIARQLGVDAEQVMVPFEHLFLDEAALPALAVVQLPGGLAHFVVLWRRVGSRVQMMDPGSGRRWVTRAELRERIYWHRTAVPAADWREWAASDASLRVLQRRVAQLGVRDERLLEAALADATWHGLGALDAALRTVEGLMRAKAIDRRQAPALLAALLAEPHTMPNSAWSVRASDDDPAQLILRGAVFVRARGRLPTSAETVAPLSRDLAAALAEPPARPARQLLRLLRADGLLTPVALTLAIFAAAATGLVEALLLRGVLDVGATLSSVGQRMVALVTLLGVLGLIALLDAPILAGVQGLGRRLEARLRTAFLHKIPRLGDRYFHSRPISDMAERSHSIHLVRQLPRLGGDVVRAACELLVTTAGLIWLDPRSAPLALTAAALAVAVPLAAAPSLVERDLRQRSHAGALARFYLDALLGLTAVRTHGAARAVRREHESLLVEWLTAGRALLRVVLGVEAVQSLVGIVIPAVLLVGYFARTGESASVLLFIYWALALPMLGSELARLVRQFPSARNVALRLTEPLGAREQESGTALPAAAPDPRGVRVTLKNVSVAAGGNPILSDVTLTIGAGEHIAIVGPSGAGKSTLVGLLLGWLEPVAGRLEVDGAPLDGTTLARLRAATAWTDPEVQLWNRSLFDNLRYGGKDAALDLGPRLEAAELRRVLETLPEGLQTHLGDGGGLVSGGEGQRVRFARALGRQEARLVILDEAFRGHDFETRRELLTRARAWWPDATLLCITHDVAEARSFPRVLVVDGGRVVEDGTPAALERPGTRFGELITAERTVRDQLWRSPEWRRLWLEGGRLRRGDS